LVKTLLHSVYDQPDPGSKPPTNKSVAEGVSALGTPISESFIYYLRAGLRDNPTKKHLEGIARYFGIPAGYFFDEDESQQIYEDLELVTAMRDADVRQLALRSSQMSPRMRQWLIQTLNALDEAQTPAGTEVPPVEGPKWRGQCARGVTVTRPDVRMHGAPRGCRLRRRRSAMERRR